MDKRATFESKTVIDVFTNDKIYFLKKFQLKQY